MQECESCSQWACPDCLPVYMSEATDRRRQNNPTERPRKKPTPKRTKQKFTYFGQRLSSDLCSFPTGIGDYKYAFCIVDAATNWLFVWLMKSKSSHEVKEAMETFLSTHQNSLSHGLSVTWHTDNGGEFASEDLDEFCTEIAVKRSYSVPPLPITSPTLERVDG